MTNNKGQKKKEEFGLHLVIGEWELTMSEPNQVTIRKKNTTYFYPNIKMAAQYIKKDIALKSGYITTIDQLEEAFNHADTLVMDALGKLPF
ncbi:MAG: hypothetical protein L0I00_08085 [Lactiplantibacillus plantarum]|nr:hypothetical protein [Lactiplantibacillus plantarum]MDN5951383.1 hypothetical protein [Loigolactobacillus coryniformis]